MYCFTCEKHVLTDSSYKQTEEIIKCSNYEAKKTVAVHTCQECGEEIPPLIYEMK